MSILFSGDYHMEKSKPLEYIRQFCTLVGAVNVIGNFIFYYLFSPAFCRALQKTIKRKSFQKPLNVNLFVVGTCGKKTGDNMLSSTVDKSAKGYNHYESIVSNCNCDIFAKEQIYLKKVHYVFAELEKQQRSGSEELSNSSYKNMSYDNMSQFKDSGVVKFKELPH